MKLNVVFRGIVAALLSLSLPVSSYACTVLSIRDAQGNVYQGRTNEYASMQPDELTYFPAGSLIESVTPDGKKGMTFNTKYAILGATLKGMTPDAKQDALHEAVNDQGMSFTVNAFTRNGQSEITLPADKVLSLVDFGTWALGNYKTTDEVKKAIESNEINVWLPNIASMWNLLAPVHFALYDKIGGAIVIEFVGGKTQVYENTVGVMTNDPPFPWHLEHMNSYARLTNVDKNSGQFQELKVQAPDSGGAIAGLPSSNISPDRFVKAAYYANYALRASSSEEAIQTLSHVMNNFDRPVDITLDEPSNTGGAEAGQSNIASSEATYFTVMNDLNQGHFYIRTIKQINFVRFDLQKLAGIKERTIVSFSAISKSTDIDGTSLFHR